MDPANPQPMSVAAYRSPGNPCSPLGCNSFPQDIGQEFLFSSIANWYNGWTTAGKALYSNVYVDSPNDPQGRPWMFYSGFAGAHDVASGTYTGKQAWDFCCSKYPLVAISAPRGHAKTTGVTVSYGLATLLFRQRKFMLLVSDTEAQAMMFLGFFKEHLQDNPALIDLFGLKRNEEGKVVFIKDTESDIIVQMTDGHKFRVIAKGAEQKLRGLIWNGTRPDIILVDDCENDELVQNKERREKMLGI